MREASELEVLRIAKIFGIRWAVSSEAERLLHEQEVAGSSPAPPTNPKIHILPTKSPSEPSGESRGHFWG